MACFLRLQSRQLGPSPSHAAISLSLFLPRLSFVRTLEMTSTLPKQSGITSQFLSYLISKFNFSYSFNSPLPCGMGDSQVLRIGMWTSFGGLVCLLQVVCDFSLSITDDIYFDQLIIVVPSGFSILVFPLYPAQFINILCTSTLTL